MSKTTHTVDISWDVREVSTISHPRNLSLLAHYEAARPAEGLPNRSDFDLIKMKDIASGLIVVQQVPEDEGLVKYRLIGSDIEERTGIVATGRSIDLFGGKMSDDLRAIYRRVFEGHEVIKLRGHLTGLSIEHVDYEMISLPIMSRDGSRVDAIGGMFSFN
ncbi:MAG: PAS domain-containing protein [Candidatus Phaeomarinobacter sp.]